jgi:hypothetical protein
MKLFFNELSLNPIAENRYSAIDRMDIFAKTVSEARKKGFRNIQCDYFTNQIELSQNYTLHHWLNDSDVRRELREFLYGVIIPPYIYDNDKEILEAFVESNITFEDIENHIPKSRCIGLASAFLYDLPSISLISNPIWSKIKLHIEVEKQGNLSNQTVFNISSKESFLDNELATYIEAISNLILETTQIISSKKSISLRNDHGKDVLQRFAERLVCSPYVISVVNSLPYNPHETKFIHKVNANGLVEIVLRGTDAGLGLAVQTTGRNMRETQEIATMLEKEFK